MSVALESRSRIAFRSHLMQTTRAFFQERGVLEVDCPALNPFATIDCFIDPVPAEGGYLHTSPEYGMKKLLAAGSGDIYQLSHVFRREEKSPLHTVEFSMLEWYRTALSFEALIDETCELIEALVPHLTFERLTYAEAFARAGYPLDQPIKLPNLSPSIAKDHAALTDLCFAECVEPSLPEGCVLTDFPAKSAALAKVAKNAKGELVAKRFEIYVRGIEVANGYDELQDSSELRARFEKANCERAAANKASFPIDEDLLAAIEAMPPCVGVAVGFDRLVMLAANAPSINAIQSVHYKL